MRLRLYSAVLIAATLVAGIPFAAAARGNPVVVLIGTEVGEAGRSTMSPALWARLVAQWVDATTIPFAGKPTLADCTRARAAYMVDAPFDLKPRLPGSLHTTDRVAAQSRILVTNCVTGQAVFDRVIALESNRISTANEGDLEPVSEITWESSVRAALRRSPIPFSQSSYVTRVEAPFVYLTAPRSPAVGQTLRVYASKDGTERPIVILTVVELLGKLVQAQYDATNPQNVVNVGDQVEPYTPPVKP